MSVSIEDMLSVFIADVNENITTADHVGEHAFGYSEPLTYEPRPRSAVGGSYWCIRRLSHAFDTKEAGKLERQMQSYFDAHCKAITDAFGGLDD